MLLTRILLGCLVTMLAFRVSGDPSLKTRWWLWVILWPVTTAIFILIR